MCLITVPVSGSAQFRVDCLDVNIRQGDITGEDADAIVASCNLDLDLTKGKQICFILENFQILTLLHSEGQICSQFWSF